MQSTLLTALALMGVGTLTAHTQRRIDYSVARTAAASMQTPSAVDLAGRLIGRGDFSPLRGLVPFRSVRDSAPTPLQTCPMPVAIPNLARLEPMPLIPRDSVQNEPMPVIRPGCINPLHR